MQDDFYGFDDYDDVESPYFDSANDQLFDEPTRNLLDRIANDPRFCYGFETLQIVEELAQDKSEGEKKRLDRAAWVVFDETVFPGLEARALQLVDQVLTDPDFDALPVWTGEASADHDNFLAAYTDPDPRVVKEFEIQLAYSDAYQRRQEEAHARVESEAREIVGKLPRRTRDLLVLAYRNADRESLLEPWTEGESQRRRGWIAYYAERLVSKKDENLVFDRYSAAVKILAGQGWSRKAIGDALGIGVGRVNRFLDRSSGRNIADDDPLCDLVPDLRGRGKAWRDAALARSHKPRPFSRLSVAEKVALTEESSDPLLLARLAKQRSQPIAEALISRHVRRGDVDEDILEAILFTDPRMGPDMIEAHRERPLPKGIALTLAEADAYVLLDCDDATARAAESLGREDFEIVLAVRDSDLDTIQRILTEDPASESFWQLIGLLIDRPLSEEMLGSSDLLTTMLRTAEHTDDLELSTALRLIACQSPEILAQHIHAANTDRPDAMVPEAVEAVALGSYHLSRSNTRRGVQTGARALWEAADLTIEHGIAREVVAGRGTEVVSFETAGNIYVATAEAIRSFRKSEITEYAYVRMRLTSARGTDVDDTLFWMLNGRPNLGYHREMRKHPVDTNGPEVEAIVWPIPFQPAIYSLSTNVGERAGVIAVSGGQVAIFEGP